MNLSTKQKHTRTHKEQICGWPGGGEGWGGEVGKGRWEGGDCELGIIKCKLLYIQWINNKILLYLVISHNGKEY